MLHGEDWRRERKRWRAAQRIALGFAEPHPLDRDGYAGGSLPADERGLDDLRATYREATGGERPDMRWGESRLREEIGAARA